MKTYDPIGVSVNKNDPFIICKKIKNIWYAIESHRLEWKAIHGLIIFNNHSKQYSDPTNNPYKLFTKKQIGQFDETE